jgi:hypothetical protein
LGEISKKPTKIDISEVSADFPTRRHLVRTTEVMPPTMAVRTLAMADITLLIPRPIAEKTCGKRGLSLESRGQGMQ